MELIKIDPSSKTSQELLSIMDENTKITRDMAKQIKKLHEESTRETTSVSFPEPNFKEEPEIKEEDEDFEQTVSYFFKKIDLLDDVSPDILTKNLPNQDDYDYEKILLRLRAELLRKSVELLRFIKEEDLSSEDRLAFETELSKNNDKMTILRNLMLTKEEQDEHKEETARNKLIFVPSPSGTPIVLNELKRIDPVYYEDFLGLFDSIRTGRFKNFTRLTANNGGYGVFEVKDFKIRVLFARLGPTEYAVISSFTKKVQTSKGYNELVTLRINDYQRVEQALKANLVSEEFLKINADYEQELDRLLGRTTEKAKVKEKKGEQND